MPRVEENDHLETYQRHGILEEERAYSGYKRICYSCGWMNGFVNKWCWITLPMALYPVVFTIGYYSGYNSHHPCGYEGSFEN